MIWTRFRGFPLIEDIHIFELEIKIIGAVANG